MNTVDSLLTLGTEPIDKAYLGPDVVYDLGVQRYVATTGNDTTGTGTKANPWFTLSKAKSEVATLISGGLTSDVTVFIRGGEYRLATTETFTPTDSDKTYTVAYRGYPGETVILNGAVDESGVWTDDGGGIYYLDLPGQADFQTLFINGKQATRARWPNEDDYHLMVVYPGVTSPLVFDYFLYDQTAGLPTIAAGETPEVILFGDFNVQRFLYSSSDATTVYLQADTDSNTRGHGINFFSHYNRYYWEGSKSFLTEPGEWYFDTQPATPRLYYKPTAAQLAGDADLSEMLVEVPAVQSLIEVHGEDSLLPALADDCTISMWFKTGYVSSPTNMDWQKTLFQNWTDGGGSFAGIKIELRQEVVGSPGPGTVQREGFMHIAYGSDQTFSDWTTGFGVLNDNVWHHLAVSIKAPTGVATGLIRMWLDGVEETNWNATYDGVLPIGEANNSSSPYIGYYSNTKVWDGEIDDVIVLDTAITTTAQANFLGDKSYTGLTANMVYHMPLDGDYSLVCDTITGVNSSWGYNISDGLNYDTTTVFVDGGIGHNPCIQFDGHDYQQISTKLRPGKRVNNLTFQNLEMTCTDYPAVTADGYSPRNGDEYDFPVPGAIDLKYGNNIKIRNCNIHDVGCSGIYSNMSENCNIDYNTVADVGWYGIIMDVQKYGDNGTRYLIADKRWENHTINHNEVHDVGLTHLSAIGILLVCTSRSQVNWNHVYNIPRIGISFNAFYTGYDEGYADLEVGYNYIHNCLQKVNHNGAIRLNGYVPGFHYHHNYIKDTLRTIQHTFRRLDELEDYPVGYPIHLDSGSGGGTVDFNLVVNSTAGTGMRWNGVFDMIINNNIFAGFRDGGAAHSQKMGGFFSDPNGDHSYPSNNAITNNVYYSATGRTGWLPDYTTNAATIAAIKAAFTGTQDYNCYYSGGDGVAGYWTSAGAIWGSWTVKSLAWIRSEWGLDNNSIEEDPSFRLNDADDYFVQNANTLALGFENFIDDLEYV